MVSGPDRILGAIIAIGLVGVAAYAGVIMLDAAYSADTEAQPRQVTDTVLLESVNAGEFVDLGGRNGVGENQVVRNSQNYSLRFTGAPDSLLQSDADFDVASGTNWTVGTGVWINESAVGESNMTVLAAGDPDVILRYENASGTANYSAYIISQTTHVINVSAADPVNASYVFVVRSGDIVTIHRHNETAAVTGESVNVTSAGTTAANLTAGGTLHGRLDETRTFNASLNSSQRTAIATRPTFPLTNATRTGRLMYDAGSGTSVRIYWASSSATASNATYAPGYNGVVLDEGSNPLLGSPTGDYAWDTEGPELAPLSSGDLAGAPVAWATYDFRPFRYQFLTQILEAWNLVDLVMLVVIVSILIAAIKGIRPDQL